MLWRADRALQLITSPKKKDGGECLFTALNLDEISIRIGPKAVNRRNVLGLNASSSRASDRTVSTSYMLLFRAALAMGPTVKLHRVFLMKACLFTAEVVSH